MKLRVMASAAVVMIALAATGCGSHLANNASRLDRMGDGARYGVSRYNAMDNGLVRNNTTIESGGRLGHTGRVGTYRTGYRGYRGYHHAARYANSARPVARPITRRMGNAVHSTRNTPNTASQTGMGHVGNETIGTQRGGTHRVGTERMGTQHTGNTRGIRFGADRLGNNASRMNNTATTHNTTTNTHNTHSTRNTNNTTANSNVTHNMHNANTNTTTNANANTNVRQNRHALNQNNLHTRDGRYLAGDGTSNHTANGSLNNGIRNTAYNYDNTFTGTHNTGTHGNLNANNINRPYLSGDMSLTNNVNRINHTANRTAGTIATPGNNL